MDHDRCEIARRLREGAPCTWEGLYRAVMGSKPPAGTTLEQDAGLLCGRLADLIEGPPKAESVRHDAMEALEWVRGHGGVDAAERRMMPEGMEWPRYADGEPVRIGDEVCGSVVDTVALNASTWDMRDAEGFRVYRTEQGGTVERDSWRAVEADAGRIDRALMGSGGVAKARGLVRRCRELAERDAR